MKGYTNTIDELVRRIEALVPDNPKILDMVSPFDLFRLPGFECKDLEPSLAQAGAALQQVKRKCRSS